MAMTANDRQRELKRRAQALEPIVRVGKNGLSDTLVDQVKKALLKRELVKIKMLRAFVEENDKKQTAKELAERTRSELVSVVGFNITLFKRGRPKPDGRHARHVLPRSSGGKRAGKHQ